MAIPPRSRPVNGSVPEGELDPVPLGVFDPLAPRLLEAGGVGVWPLTMELPPDAAAARTRPMATTAKITSMRFNPCLLPARILRTQT